MNRFVFVILLFLGFNLGTTEAQISSSFSIPWEQSKKLVWNDFKGKPQPTDHKVAATQYQIGYEYTMEDNEFIFDVSCEFIPRLSWVDESGKTEYILNHEQKHFDLAEVYARKLRKELNEADINLRNYQRMTNDIYDKIWRECQVEQIRYDKETNHSINEAEQEEWDEYIEEQLYLYEDYRVTPFNKNVDRRSNRY